MTNFLIGIAIYQVGLDSLAKSIDSLDRATCEQLQRELEHFPIESAELEQVFIRDLEFAKQQMGVFEFFVVKWQTQANLNTSRQSVKSAFDLVRSLHEQLQIRVAVRQFFLDKQRMPKTLAELSQDYLPQSLEVLPTDTSFVYRSENDSFELYSTGPDGIDNGGPSESSDDIGLDSEEEQLTTPEEAKPEINATGL